MKNKDELRFLENIAGKMRRFSPYPVICPLCRIIPSHEKNEKPLQINTGLYDCTVTVSCINQEKYPVLIIPFENTNPEDLFFTGFKCEQEAVGMVLTDIFKTAFQ